MMLTEIVFILDRSGSMTACAGGAIAGFNEFLGAQRENAGEARFTLVLFNDEEETPWFRTPPAAVKPLDDTTFDPDGRTALLDAVGGTIDRLGARLAAEPEAERPGKVIVAILTDGHENASTRFTEHEVKERIRHQTEVYRWEFLFLGANQDAFATAERMSIGRHHVASIAGDRTGMGSSGKALRRKVVAMRKASMGVAMSAREAVDLAAPLGELTGEEDARARWGRLRPLTGGDQKPG